MTDWLANNVLAIVLALLGFLATVIGSYYAMKYAIKAQAKALKEHIEDTTVSDKLDAHIKETDEYKKDTTKQHRTESDQFRAALEKLAIAQAELIKDQILRNQYNGETTARIEENIKDLSEATSDMKAQAGRLEGVVTTLKELRS